MLPLQSPPWGFVKRVWMLFITVYFLFLMLDFTSSDELFPHFINVLFTPLIKFWDWIVPWTGQHILHLKYPITVKPNGSGDTTYNYVMQLLWLVLAMVIAVVWAILDRARPNYIQLAYWLRIFVRYYFAFVLFVYGFDKIIKLQFPSPGLMRLSESYGDSSPMGLAWTFIGYSKGYNIYIGSAEVLGGILLFFKRTTLLGALIGLTVMMNVAAMNFAYDIPVKIFSVNLVVVAGYLAAYDLRRIINFFILNKNAGPAYTGMPLKTKWKKIVQVSLKILFILFALYSTLWSSIKMAALYGDAAPKPPLYGIYKVQAFVRKGDTLPPLTTDTSRWKMLIINYPGTVTVTTMNDSIRWYQFKLDSGNLKMTFTSIADSTIGFVFNYKKEKDNLILNGRMYEDSTIILMKRFDENSFRLVSRGFHWINEYPYNR